MRYRGQAAMATAALTMTAAMAAAAMPAASPTVLYVATNGNDAWTGRLAAPNRAHTDGPLATPAAARDRIGVLRGQGKIAGPVTVLLRGGTYYLAAPLVFGPQDSGASGAPVTFAAYKGEHPVLSGGQPVTGWQQEVDGLWSSAAIPDADGGGAPTAGLFVGNARRSRTVLPKDGGFYHIAERVPPSAPNQPDDRFRFAPGDIRADWRNLTDVDVLCFHIWSASRIPVAAVDPAANIVVFGGHGPSAANWGEMKTGDRYRVENVFEALPDEPGAWYADRAAHRLYYHPLPGERLAGFAPVAPHLERLVVFAGDPAAKRWVTNVTLRGLTLRDTDWRLPPQGHAAPQAEVDLDGAVEAVGARDCRLEDCEIAHTGAYAVQWGRGCQRDALIRCDLHDLGGGGVKIGEGSIPSDPDHLASDNLVQDCRIYDGGILHPAAVGVWIGQSPGNRIVHDTIHDLYYTGISIGWTWGYGDARAQNNTVDYCDIYNIGRGVLSDMGGIYTLGNQQGSRLTHNRIHDVVSYDYGGWGIYFDEGTTGILAEDNIVYRTKTGGFHQHYGKDNVVRNNVFALSKEAQLQRTRAEDHVSFTFEKNIVYWNSGNLLANNWKDGQFAMDDNLYWDTRPGAVITFAGLSWGDWRKTGHDPHSVIADPRFTDLADPARSGFRLRRDSPAFSLGFQPIDLRDVGAAKR